MLCIKYLHCVWHKLRVNAGVRKGLGIIPFGSTPDYEKEKDDDSENDPGTNIDYLVQTS